MLFSAVTASIISVLGFASGKIYFEERFGDKIQFESRWKSPKVLIKNGKEETPLGHMQLAEGGLKTLDDERCYIVSSQFERFSNEGRDLVVQFTVRDPQMLDCGGGFINIYDSKFDPTAIDNSDVPLLSFGPDRCAGDHQILVTWKYKDKRYPIKKDLPTPYDTVTHLYTLIVRSDLTYTVLVDLQTIAAGTMSRDWAMLPPEYIKDPDAKRPEGWVNATEIDDPEDAKPGDWNDHLGEWKPRKITNPKYEGPWIAPMIENPDYRLDEKLYRFPDIGAVGINIWQSQSGTVFDNILLTDDLEYAESVAREVWEPLYKEQKDEYEEKIRQLKEKYEALNEKIRDETYAEHMASYSKEREEADVRDTGSHQHVRQYENEKRHKSEL